MNKQLWNLYKESERGKKCIELFNPEIENTYTGITTILNFLEKWEENSPVDKWLDFHFLFSANLPISNLLPEDGEWTREKFNNLIENYQLIDAFENENGEIEAKFDMSLIREQQNAFSQGLSYARLLRCIIMGVCDKERLILYKVDNNGFADRNSPIFEEHWASIYGNSEIGAKLNQLIGREVIINM